MDWTARINRLAMAAGRIRAEPNGWAPATELGRGDRFEMMGTWYRVIDVASPDHDGLLATTTVSGATFHLSPLEMVKVALPRPERG